MKMNRGLITTLCALALATGSLAHGQAPTVNLSLNLRYTHPLRPQDGGTWYLVGKTDATNGIAAVNAYITNINSTVTYGTAATAFGGSATGGNATPTFGNYSLITGTNLAAELTSPGNAPFVVAGSAGVPTNVVYFQDTANGPIAAGVGTAAYAQRQKGDPLRNTTTWNNATVIAAGTFTGGGNAANLWNRPAFGSKGGNSTDANALASVVVPSNNAVDANVTLTVRGDSVIIKADGTNVTTPLESPAGAGLRFGDRNRSGTITYLADIDPALTNLGPTTGRKWEDGDFSGNGTITYLADIDPALTQLGLTAPPAPAIAAVPEPATGLLILSAIAGLAARRRSR